MFANEAPQTVAIFILHVDKFNSAAARAQIPHYGGKMDLAKSRAYFQLNRFTDVQAAG